MNARTKVATHLFYQTFVRLSIMMKAGISMKLFRQRFIQAKGQSGLRWIDIANRSGLDKASISQYKNGVHTPEPDALYRLALALNVSMEWLTGAEISVSDSEILNQYHQLNDLGKSELIQFLDDLSSNQKYKK